MRGGAQAKQVNASAPPLLEPPAQPDIFSTVRFPGGLAQLGERHNGIVEVRGSTPLSSIRDEAPRRKTRAPQSLGGPPNWLP